MPVIGIAIIFFVVIFYITYLVTSYLRTKKIVDVIGGPRTHWLIGNVIQFRQSEEEFFEQTMGVMHMYGRTKQPRIVRIWIACKPIVVVFGAETCEAILSSNKHINKADEYKFLHPWMGLGLLTSYAEKWRPRRKLLTPTFHYDILKDFMCVFNEQARVFVNLIGQHVGEESYDVYRNVTLCALDIICDSAMGKCVNAQLDLESEYVKAIYLINDIIRERQKKPWVYPNLLFQLIGRGKQHDYCVKVLHDFTEKVIHERYAARQGNGGDIGTMTKVSKRLAFLDLLLDMHSQDTISLQDIRDEVNTFMFEGHDTTSAGMCWTLHLLGCNPEIQAKVHAEVDQIFGDDSRDIRYEDLKDMFYLECCIKESLRLYPSVAMFARALFEDMQICGYTIPAGTTVIIFPYAVHRDPVHWPDPEKFRPERFYPDENAKRHPYAYLPFSAGARNCIGQRFALMEEKTVLAWVMRYFRVTSVHRRDQVRPKNELILRPAQGVHLKLELRRPLPTQVSTAWPAN